jgi:proteasome lid subunit RPN8/RPN11
MLQTTLKLSADHQKFLRQHIDSDGQNEVCGLIGGVWQPYDRLALAQAVIPIPNAAADPRVRYAMLPAAQSRAMLTFEQQGWETIGIYHSHPQGIALPSPTDIAEALYPDAVYVIGVPQGELRAWRIQRGRVWEVLLCIE